LNIFAPTNQSELRLPPLPNPLGITIPPGIYGPLNGISFLGIAVVTLIVAVSVVIRFRQAAGEEREQLKWFAYAGVLAAFVFAIIIFGVFLLPDAVMTQIGGVLFSLLLAGFPLAIGVAILKYRLYDIDLLINRTLVYVPLTGIIAGIFAASITLSQELFVALTGQQSEAATVLTTLIVVAAFEPIKSGLQHLVDRRFKEARDPTEELHAIRDQARTLLQVIDMKPSTRHLLDAAVRAFNATGGAVSLLQNGEAHVLYTSREWTGEAHLSVPLENDGTKWGELALGARRSGADYSEQDRAALLDTVAPVSRAWALTARMTGGQK
jgi:hypothetical protein